MALEIFRLVGSVFVDTDEANKSLQKTDKNAEGFGQTLLNGIGTAAKWAAGIAAAAGTAAAALSVASLKSYADYEQLVGGVETLFGDSADTMLQYAEGAYKSAGLTANAYLETVTGFSASLLQSLDGDTAAAAEYANMAITDMADNANKMGSSIESIQAAYQGFAKQQYTLLDNLKLGYGGTQAEMERLLEDATKLSGVKYDITNLSDVYDAIHVIQTEIGITGTTAAEAESTISGSIAMIKAKLENFKTTIGSALAPVVKEFLALVIDQLPTIEAGVNQLANVWIPGLITAISNCATWIQENSDKIVGWTGYIVAASAGVAAFLLYLNWGQIMSAAAAALNLVKTSVQKLNTTMSSNPIGLVISLITTLIAYLGYLYATNEEFRAFVDEMLSVLWEKVKVVIAWIQANVVPVIQEIIEWLQANALPILQSIMAWFMDTALPALQSFLASVWEKLKDVFAWIQANVVPVIQEILNWINANVVPVISTIISWLSETLGGFWSWLTETIGGFWSWLTSSFQSTGNDVGGIWETIKGFFQSAWDFIVGIWEACQPFFQGIWDGIILPVAGLVEQMIGAFQMAWDDIVLLWDMAAPYFELLWEGIKAVFSVVADVLGGFFSAAWDVIKVVWDLVAPYFTMLWEGIKAVFSVVGEVLGGFFSTAWEVIKAVWDIVISYFTAVWAGIEAVFAVVKGVLSGDFSDAWVAIEDAWSQTAEFFGSVWSGIQNVFAAVGDWFGGVFSAAWEGIKSVWDAVVDYFSAVWAGIGEIFSVVEGAVSGYFSDAWSAVTDVWDGAGQFFSTVWAGIQKAFSSTTGWFSNTFSTAWGAVQKVFSDFGSFFSGLWNTITTTFTDLGTQIGDAIGGAVKAGINGVISTIEKTINGFIGLINGAIDLINMIPGVNLGKLKELSFPRLEKGGVLEKGEVGLLEGNGAEAVVPLHQNQKWISAVARDMDAAIGRTSGDQEDIEQHLLSIRAKLDDLLDALLATQTITMNKREFARLVKEVG